MTPIHAMAPARSWERMGARGFGLALGVALLTLAAKAEVPFWPVPMTLHTLAVMGLAATLPGRAAMAVFVAYLLAGAAGLPVFSGTPERGIGILYMAGPTGGYLLGYLAATGIVGRWGKGQSLARLSAALLAGLAVVYLCGGAWLSLYVPASRILAVGITPFIAGDLVKLALVVAGVAGVRRWREDRV